jgi:hypothetical protein
MDLVLPMVYVITTKKVKAGEMQVSYGNLQVSELLSK